MDSISSEPTEEREDDMSSLAVGFAAQMRKRAASAQRETTSGFEGLDGKQPKRSGLDGVVQKSPVVITMDSPERALEALSFWRALPKVSPGRLVHRWRMGF